MKRDMREASPRLGVAGIIVHEGKLLLGESKKNPGFWILPGGKLEFGEGLLKCLRREYREETHLNIIVDNLLGVYEITDPAKGGHRVIIYYHGRVRSGKLKAGSDLADAKFLTRAEIRALRRKRRLTPLMVTVLKDIRWL